MAFSSTFFLFAFFPTAPTLYFVTPRPARNLALLLISVLFYAFDAGYAAWLLIASVIVNHAAARMMERWPGSALLDFRHCPGPQPGAAALLQVCCAFLWVALATMYPGAPKLSLPTVADLPIGISFFTFQAISYIADVYMRATSPARSWIDFGAYHTLFPS